MQELYTFFHVLLYLCMYIDVEKEKKMYVNIDTKIYVSDVLLYTLYFLFFFLY